MLHVVDIELARSEASAGAALQSRSDVIDIVGIFFARLCQAGLSVDHPRYISLLAPIVSAQLMKLALAWILFICTVIGGRMYFLITRMRDKGVARDWKAIRQAVGIRGDINIRPQMCALLNRSSDIAEILPQGMPLDAVPLPPLLDARLSGMATNAFTLSGLEEIDGVLYAQSWWCRED